MNFLKSNWVILFLMLAALVVTIFGLCFELILLGIAAAALSFFLGICSTHSAYVLSKKIQKNTALIQESDKALGIKRNKDGAVEETCLDFGEY